MSNNKSGFLIGLGSNISPFDNFPKMIGSLLEHFAIIHLSRVLNIPPVGMNSQLSFLNAVAFIETDMDEADLKQICNQTEVLLGRDREDPDSKHRDRPADIDILLRSSFPAAASLTVSSITDEYFLYPLIEELKAYLTDQPLPAIQSGTPLSLNSLLFGESATTINGYRHSS